MNRLTDEQLMEIWWKAEDARSNEPMISLQPLVFARAFFKASCEIAPAEPSEEDIEESGRPAVMPSWQAGDYARGKVLFSNRRRALLEQPDEAVKAAHKIIARIVFGSTVAEPTCTNWAQEIVAAVDAARGRK